MASEKRGGDGSGESAGGTKKPKEQLHIFVNRRKFEESDGVLPEMTGRQIAALVGVPEDVAVVRRGNSGDSPEISMPDPITLHQAEHFLVTRRTVEGGYDAVEVPPRIRRELERLADGGQAAEYHPSNRESVIYRAVPTGGAARGLPSVIDVLVPVPGGYPASMIDLAALPLGSPFLSLVKGGNNNQGVVQVADAQWQLASYHPHNNGGGPPWDQMKHGFHTYFDELIAWLANLA